MQNLWQKKLKLNYSKEVIDIVQFGSSIIENSNPNDVDIAVFFLKIPIKEQLNQAQRIKEQLEKYSEIPIHISSYDLYNFFQESNFAREGILFYGKSLISGKDFSTNFGFVPKIQIYYNLDKLDKKDKVRFNYMLNGRKGEYGLLRKYGGKLLRPGLIEVEMQYENIFIKDIEKITKNYETRKILINI